MNTPSNLDQIPSSLRGTYEMIRASYPDGVPESGYFPLLGLLKDHMSFRGLARVIAAAVGKDYPTVYHDALAAASPFKADPPQSADIERVRQRLLPHGFDQWCVQEQGSE